MLFADRANERAWNGNEHVQYLRLIKMGYTHIDIKQIGHYSDDNLLETDNYGRSAIPPFVQQESDFKFN